MIEETGDAPMSLVVGVLIFVGVFVAGPYLVVVALRALGKRGGYGDLYAPDLPRSPRTEWPLTCRLHLYHRWRTRRTPEGIRFQRCLGCGATRDVPGVGLPI